MFLNKTFTPNFEEKVFFFRKLEFLKKYIVSKQILNGFFRKKMLVFLEN